LFIVEAVRFSVESLRANRMRAVLTGLGMIIGTASIILVVTITMTGRDYILAQIQGVGSNLIFAHYAADESKSHSLGDKLTAEDMKAVRGQITNALAVAAIILSHDRMLVGGQERDITVLGTNPDFRMVRNLTVLSGRFLDSDDLEARNKVCLLTIPLAQALFGDPRAGIGRQVRVHGLQFTVIGTFKEGVETFGQGEISKETALIPMTVMRYFIDADYVDQIYAAVARPEEVVPTSARIKQVIESRHRPGSVYLVDNLTAILDAAKRVALALTVTLLVVSAITLVVSGIGIMNIMLVTVTERTREIGIKLAIGARRREILVQFLAEAVFLSVAGGVLGILLGLAVPLSVRLFLDDIRIPVSGAAIVVAFAVSVLVGVVFGVLPANRASRLKPVEALRYE
jgi:putative ABC transport system permease protein